MGSGEKAGGGGEGGGEGGEGGEGVSTEMDGVISPVDNLHPSQPVTEPRPVPGLGQELGPGSSVPGTISPLSNSNVTTARRSKSRQTSITQSALSVAHFLSATMKLGKAISPTPSVTGDPPCSVVDMSSWVHSYNNFSTTGWPPW